MIQLSKIALVMILSLLFLVSFGTAATVETNVFFDANGKPLTDVNLELYRCASKECSLLLNPDGSVPCKSCQAQPVLIRNSGSTNTITFNYPASSVETHYAQYLYVTGFIPREFVVTDFCPVGFNCPTNIYSNFFENVAVCRVPVTPVLFNAVHVHEPLQMRLQTHFETSVISPVKDNLQPPHAVPAHLRNTHYSVNTKLNLIVANPLGETIFSETKTVPLFMSEAKDVSFSFVPQTAGNQYSFSLISQPADAKCVTVEPSVAQQKVTVLEARPRNHCFTQISDVTVTPEQHTQQQSVVVRITANSFLADQNAQLTTLGSEITCDVTQQGTPLVHMETQSEDLFECTFIPLSSESYEVVIGAVPSDLACDMIPQYGESVLLSSTIPTITPITIPLINVAPVFTSEPVTIAATHIQYVYDADAFDANPDDTVRYTLIEGPVGMFINAVDGVLMWAPQQGVHTVTVRATDSLGLFTDQTFEVAVGNSGVFMPVILSQPLRVATPHMPYFYNVEATAQDTSALEFHLLDGPDGMTIDENTGLISYPDPVSGTYRVSIRVNAGVLTDTQVYDLVVKGVQNTPPAIVSNPPVSHRLGQTLDYTVEVHDERDNFVLTLDQAPAGMTLDGNHVVATNLAEGLYTVTIRVTDEYGAFDLQYFVLEVAEFIVQNEPPFIISNPPTVAFIGKEYSYKVIAQDPDGDALVYTLTQAPVGMTITDQGMIIYLPLQFGIFPVTVTVSDQHGATDTQSFVLEVREIVVENQPPVILSYPLTVGYVGEQYVYAPFAYDPDGDTLSYVLDDGPEGMSMDRRGTVRYLPTEEGVFSVSIRVMDDHGGFAIQQFELEISDRNHPPHIISEPITQAVPGKEYRYELRAQDIDNDPLTYVLDKAPAGMTISSSGVIEFTPRSVGKHIVVVRVVDPSGLSDTQEFTLTVKDVVHFQITSAQLSCEHCFAGEQLLIEVSLEGKATVELFASIPELGVRSVTQLVELRKESYVLLTLDFPDTISPGEYVVRIHAQAGNTVDNEQRTVTFS